MVYDLYPKGPRTGPPEIDRCSYDPLHDYRSIDVDAWAEKWFSCLAEIDPDSEEYRDFERIIGAQMALHPESREADAHDLRACMGMLRLICSENPFDANAGSVATGVKFGHVNNLDEVEQLKRNAEESMEGAKHVFRSLIETSRWREDADELSGAGTPSSSLRTNSNLL